MSPVQSVEWRVHQFYVAGSFSISQRGSMGTRRDRPGENNDVESVLLAARSDALFGNFF